MCTIGAIINRRSECSYFFKNIDQTVPSKYRDPYFVDGKSYRYLKVPSGEEPGTKGILAGVNDAGVVILGADGNCMPNYCGYRYSSLNESLITYERILSECENIWEATNLVMKTYQDLNIGGNGDILIIGDRKEAVALEYTPNCWGVQYRGDNAYMIRSNFFVLLDHLRPLPVENSLHTSSAIRYNDALRNLSRKGKANELEDVFDLVRSHDQGMNAMSICRHGGRGEYFTHGSFVVKLAPKDITAYVSLNGKPCEKEFVKYTF